MPTDMSGVTPQNRTSKSSSTGKTINAVFEDPKDRQVSIDDFLQLMAAQLKNQDFMNPVDDTQYMAQLAQFTTLQQMEEMAYNSKTTFASSMVGKTAVAAKINANGDLKRTEGVIDKVSFVDNKFLFYIGSLGFTMDEIMEVTQTKASSSTGGETNGGSTDGAGDNSGGEAGNKSNT